MRLKVYLEHGETEDDLEEFLEKAIKNKHEHQHLEKFEDPLVEQLLEEMDHEVKDLVFIGGFEDVLGHLLSDATGSE